jgi:hypothetical protein
MESKTQKRCPAEENDCDDDDNDDNDDDDWLNS